MNDYQIISDIVYKWSEEEVKKYFHKDMSYFPFTADAKWADPCKALSFFVSEKTKFNRRDRNIMEVLLKAGANPMQLIGPKRYTLIRILAERKESDLVILFLSYIRDIDSELVGGWDELTPLHLAVKYELMDVLKYVLSRNPNINAKNDYQLTPLHMAAHKESRYKFAQILLENGANLESKTRWGDNAITEACKYNTLEIFKLFLQNGANLIGNDQGAKALSSFCTGVGEKNMQLGKLLLELGCNPNASVGENAETPLHHLVKSQITNKTDIISLFMRYGANLNVRNNDGESILHQVAIYCSCNNLYVLIFLLGQGADGTLLNNQNRTFFDSIIESSRREYASEVIKFLILEEKNPNHRLGTRISDLQRTIKLDPILVKLQSASKMEMEKLSGRKISLTSDFSFFELVSKKPKELAGICINNSIKDAIEMFDVERFPIYGEFIKKKFQEALKLRETQILIQEYLQRITGEIIEDHIALRVFDNISVSNLEKLKKDLYQIIND